MDKAQLKILMADDDEDDRLLLLDAMSEVDASNSLSIVEDGMELMDYLQQRNARSLPDLILSLIHI